MDLEIVWSVLMRLLKKLRRVLSKNGYPNKESFLDYEEECYYNSGFEDTKFGPTRYAEGTYHLSSGKSINAVQITSEIRHKNLLCVLRSPKGEIVNEKTLNDVTTRFVSVYTDIVPNLSRNCESIELLNTTHTTAGEEVIFSKIKEVYNIN